MKTMRTPIELVDEAVGHAEDVYRAYYRGDDAEAKRSEVIAIVKGLAAIASAIESLRAAPPAATSPESET